jgi:Glycosyl hydrolase family 76
MPTYQEAAKDSYGLLVEKWDSMKPFEGQNDAFWIAGNTLQTFLDYWVTAPSDFDAAPMHISIDFFHKTVPTKSTTEFLDALAEKGLKGTPGGNWSDDYGWWANAFLTALENAEQLRLSDDVPTLLQDAENCWYLMHHGWDAKAKPLPGGVWNCKVHNWKMTGRNTVTNLQYWLTSVRLAAFTKDSKYLDPETDILQWFETGFKDNRLFDPDSHLVRERMAGFFHAEESAGFYWAGDQGLFIGCLLAEKRSMTPLFQSLRDQVANCVAKKMIDDSQVLHDHVLSDTDFDNDYACGKGVFMRHAMPLAKLTKDPTLVNCILKSADSAYQTADSNGSIHFDWNPNGKLPAGDWDNTTRTPGSPFRGMITQASGVNLFTAAAALAPNGVIP